MVDMASTIKDKLYASATKISVNKNFPGEDLEKLFYARVVQYDEREKDHKSVKDKIQKAKRASGLEFYLDNTPVKRVRILYAYDKNTWLVMDPRGFCVEVDKDNIAYVMRYCTVSKGVIEDECVWGYRSGNRLIAKESPEYELAKKATKVIKSKVSVRDIKQGNGILLKNGRKANYLGRIPFLGVITGVHSYTAAAATQWASLINAPSLLHVHISNKDSENNYTDIYVSKSAPTISSRVDEIESTNKACLALLNKGIRESAWLPSSISSGSRQSLFPLLSDEMQDYKFKLTKKNMAESLSFEDKAWNTTSSECSKKLGKGLFIMKSDTGCSLFAMSQSGWDCNVLYQNLVFDSIGTANLRAQTSPEDSDQYFDDLTKNRISDIVSFLNDRKVKDVPNIIISTIRKYKPVPGYYWASTPAPVVYEKIDSVWEVTIVDKDGNIVENFT